MTSTRTARRSVAAGLACGLIFVVGCGSDDDASSSTTTAPATTEPTSTTGAPVTTAAPETTTPATTPATTATTAAPTTTTAAPTTTTAPATTTTAAPATTEAPQAGLPDTPVTAVLEQAYDFAGGAPDPELLPAQPGEVTARWFRAGATYAVVYDGLAPDAPACPGNSAQTTAGFEFVSNSPLPGASCDSFQTLIESNATQGVQVCGEQVSYLTLIPVDTIALLFASVERELDDGGGVGLTGWVVLDDPTVLPDIDPASLSC